MKALYFILPFVFASCGIGSPHSDRRLKPLDIQNIELGEIKKELYDTVSVQLSSGQIAQLVKCITTTKDAELRKTVPEYWVFIKLKTGEVRGYKARERLLGEGDLYIELKSKDYFRNIYEHHPKRRHLISVK